MFRNLDARIVKHFIDLLHFQRPSPILAKFFEELVELMNFPLLFKSIDVVRMCSLLMSFEPLYAVSLSQRIQPCLNLGPILNMTMLLYLLYSFHIVFMKVGYFFL